MTMFKFALVRMVRNPLSIILGLVIPLALLLISPMWEEGGRGYYWIAFTLLLSAFPLTRGVQTDMKERVIMRVMNTPTTIFKYLCQNLAACMFPFTLQIIFICLFGMIRYDWSSEVAGMLGILYTLFAMTAIGIACAWASLIKNSEDENGSAIMITIMTFSIMFGIMLPVETLNGWLETVGMIFPTYWVSVGIEELLYVAGYSGEMLIQIGVLTLFTIIFLLYGSRRGT